MGVTIHFEGKLKSSESYKEILAIAADYAKKIDSEIITLDSKKKTLKRMRNENEWNYKGSVKGVQLQPNLNSDPLILEFDKDLYIQEFCKTQFAGIETHISIIEFLREVKHLFDFIDIMDEGEYYETSDLEKLEFNFQQFFEEFEKVKQEEPQYSGPYRIDGRIVDLMEK